MLKKYAFILILLSLLICGSAAAQDGLVCHVIRQKAQAEGLEGKVFHNLKAAVRGSASSWHSMDYIKPGATIIIHAGTYKADRYSYRDSYGLMCFGTNFPSNDSPQLLWLGDDKPAPLTIKAAGDGDVIFDRDTQQHPPPFGTFFPGRQVVATAVKDRVVRLFLERSARVYGSPCRSWFFGC